MSDTAEAQQTKTRLVCILWLIPIKGTNQMFCKYSILQNHWAADSAEEGSASRLHGSTKLKLNRLGLKCMLKPFIALVWNAMTLFNYGLGCVEHPVE